MIQDRGLHWVLAVAMPPGLGLSVISWARITARPRIWARFWAKTRVRAEIQASI